MVFSDLFFLFVFLPAFIISYAVGSGADRLLSKGIERSVMCRNVVLVSFSLIFYAWGEPVYVFLMLASVLANYFAGLAIDRRRRFRKAALVGGLAFNLANLATFKYLGFFAATLRDIGVDVADPGIALPIGISFYTFQAISYLVDVYRRESPAQRRFVDLLLYISMFPQLIAGPIVRYDTVAREILDRRTTAADIAEGSYRFFIGLGKKVIIANQLSEIADRFLAAGFDSLSGETAWIGLLAFTFQIFFDFSGYSDMAIGMGRCLGFHFNENFRHPYCCDTVTDFWRRWHISLGSFFRDYVYIPMGGNRSHQALNIMTVWFLTGMWHGASWNFILWGVYFGIIVMLEKYTVLRIRHLVPSAVLHVYSLFLVVLGWGIFYFDDTERMLAFFPILFGSKGFAFDITAEAALLDNFWLWVAAIVFSMPVYSFVSAGFNRLLPADTWYKRDIALLTRLAVSVALLVVSAALLVGATNNAFIYTRF